MIAICAAMTIPWRSAEPLRFRDPPLPVDGRTVILVDDGLATGSTIGARETCEALRALADDVVCALTPEPFSAVGLWYDDFSQTTDDEVRHLLAAQTANSTRTRSA
jgi:predicted phosphoribosyltransferase